MDQTGSMESVTVLTTAEHAGLFKSVFGPKADYRFNPTQTMPLEQFLANLTVGGGTLVILDEAHFVSAEGMVRGIKRYANNPRRLLNSLRIIVVCPKRLAGDLLLFELAALCGIYDLVYNTTSMDTITALNHLVRRGNSRLDVLELLDQPKTEPSALSKPYGEFAMVPEQRLVVRIAIETEQM